MNVYSVVGRHIEITEGLKSHLDTKMEKLNKHFQENADARVVLSLAASPHIAKPAKTEIQVNVPGGIVRVEEEDADMYVSIDRAVDRMEYQLKRFKERNYQRSKQSTGLAGAEVLEPVLTESLQDEDEQSIVRVKKFHLRPMAPEDAAFEMESLGHDFYMFRNGTNEEVNVIYRRKNGDYGLIEPH